jgi:flagella basal body P-ring formation protein FlgA
MQGGDESLRRQIAALDVTERSDAVDQSVSRRQVQIRLLLAGFTPSEFDLAGPEHVTVTRFEAIFPDERFADAIRTALASQFRLDPRDLDVRVVQPVTPRPHMNGVSLESVSLNPVLPMALPLGRTRIQVEIVAERQSQQQVGVTVEVALYQTAAAAARLIPAGEALTQDNVVSQRIRVVGPTPFASPADVVGRTAARMLRPGEVIRPHDAQSGGQAEESPILIRPAETVRIVARKGRLTVTLSAAEALQSGRLGETIRVRNPDSKRTITARVVGPGELEVSL